MIFRATKVRITIYTISLIFGLFSSFAGQAGATGPASTPELDRTHRAFVQLIPPYPTPYPYPQPYPPGYYPPSPDQSRGTRDVRPSGWISIEVDPLDAAVFIDGIKLELGKDNTYEEGVFTGRHKVEVKKKGYQNHLEIVDVQAGAQQSLTIRLKKLE
jgi:PEGA domain